ncbi:DNA cytosine methyltransferase [Trueperella pyogenes]|uniref:DNA cytosine methyltransferase n=1 Tax=Trueperella pyogenes TaxID=1661 RepID=UPI00345CDB3F
MTLGSLFTGYGGLDIGCAAAFGDIRTSWVSEVEPGPLKVLTHRYPNAAQLGDITKIDWTTIQPVDVIAGGSPCQDLSLAGKRKGMHEGTRSGLWESMREAIYTLNPTFVVWENVEGALSATATSHSQLECDKGPLGDQSTEPANRALGRLLGDLAEGGYDAFWTTLRASDIGACHHRRRVFVLGVRRDAADALRGRAGRGAINPTLAASWGHHVRLADVVEHTLPTPNTMDTLPVRDGEAREKALRRGGETSRRRSTGNLREEVVHALPTPDVRSDNRKTKKFGNSGNNFYDIIANRQFGAYAPAIRRQSQAFGHPAPDPTEPNPRTGKPQLSARFTEWMMGLEPGWITDVPGITRAEAIRMCGNGVVPQQATAALIHLIETADQYLTGAKKAT